MMFFIKLLFASMLLLSSLLASIPMLEKVGEKNTIRILKQAPKEGASEGSYTLYVYDKYGEFVVGEVAPRYGEVKSVWFIEEGNDFKLFVWSVSAGSGSYGVVDGYEFYDKKLKKIKIEEPQKKLLEGYMGHDVFKVDAKNIYRSFPIYNLDDTNSDRPTKRRCLVYSLSSKIWKSQKCKTTNQE